MRRLLSCLVLLLSACGGRIAALDPPGGAVNGSMAAPAESRGGDGSAVYLSAATPVTAPACPAPAALRRELLEAVNLARANARKCGSTSMPAVPELVWNEQLQLAAYRHAADMARFDFISHTGHDGSSVATRVSAHGYAWRWVGENLAAGQPEVGRLVAGWLASPDHCRNIMKRDFVDLGAACVATGGSYRYFWALVLASPQ